MRGEKLGRALIGQLRGILYSARPHFSGKAVVQPLIIMKGHVAIVLKAVMHRLLNFRRHEPVSGGDVQHDRLSNRMLLAQLDGFAHDLHAFLTMGARVPAAP